MNQEDMQKHKNAGVTLVELIISIAILGVIMLIVDRFILHSTIFLQKGKNEANLQAELQIVTDHVSDTLMECETVTGPIIDGGKRYILRQSQSKALILVFDSSTKKLQQRNVEVLASQLTGEGTEKEKYDRKMNEFSGSAYDSNLGTLSSYVKDIEITNDMGRLYLLKVTVENKGVQLSCSKQVSLRNS